jgi:hypothetical protein
VVKGEEGGRDRGEGNWKEGMVHMRQRTKEGDTVQRKQREK